MKLFRLFLILCFGFSIGFQNIEASDFPEKVFPIADTGTEFPVKYEKYGVFLNVGYHDYKYKVTDRRGMAKAIGPGLYPNAVNGVGGVTMLKDKEFKRWNRANRKKLNPWDYVSTGDPRVDFYVWTRANDVTAGIRTFYQAQALAEGGHLKQAIKAYHAILVHFPKEVCYTADRNYFWYLAPQALQRIQAITRLYPDLGYRLVGAKVEIENGKDNDRQNDVFSINPGKWEKVKVTELVSLGRLKIVKQRGRGRVQLVQFKNKHWQMWVDRVPFFIQAMTYNPTAIGMDLAGGAGNRWMFDDIDENGRPDAPYDSWIDANNNGVQDPDEKSQGDFKIMKEMGVNAVRIFRFSQALEYDPEEFDKGVMRDMQRTYGIWAIMGDFLGAYTVGSGANWEEGTDYTDKTQRKNMKRLIKQYVLDHRNEPYVLMWLLGNENLMPPDYSGVNATRTQAANQVKAYLKFVDEIAKMIKKLDPHHPVAVGNLDTEQIEAHGKYLKHVDIFGANAYRGSHGFGDLWETVQKKFDRPVLITEYGCDAYNSNSNTEDENGQELYHKGAWRDIKLNKAGGRGVGNSIGGIIFEYLDEWWKSHNGAWTAHDKTQDVSMPFPDGWSSEEWLGIFSQGQGTDSPFLRVPRKAYFLYKYDLWAPEE